MPSRTDTLPGMGTTVALLLAGGSGNRLGRQAKGFVELGGTPLFLHFFRTIVACPQVDAVVIVVPDGYAADARSWARSTHCQAVVQLRVAGSTRLRGGLTARPALR